MKIYCDASKSAYGIVIYFHLNDNSHRFILAKGRVNPIKSSIKLTIPQLELIAAAYSVEVWSKIKSSFSDYEHIPINYYSDSSVTIDRLSNSPFRQPLFVRNRVQKILKESKAHQWFSVPTEINPADIISRGKSSDKLINNQLWWSNTSQTVFSPSDSSISINAAIINHPSWYNSLDLAFNNSLSINAITNHRKPHEKFCKIRFWFILSGIINWLVRKKSPEQQQHLKAILPIRFQQASIRETINRDLEQHKFVEYNKTFLFLDPDKLLRVKLRFSTTDINIDSPLVLDGRCHLTFLWLKNEHRKFNHAPTATILNTLRKDYFIFNLRNTLKRIEHGCMTCRLHKLTKPNIEFGSIPSFRTHESVFKNIGIDFFGPFLIRETQQKKSRRSHVYILIATCAVTRGVHLEVINSMNSKDTWFGLQNIFNRRAVPDLIVSDNAKTFIKIADDIRGLATQYPVLNQSTKLKWKFIPTYSPWVGGFYERLIGCVKRAFEKILLSQVVPRNEFITLVTQAEAIVNSRPLCEAPDGFNSAITPAHFLTGNNLIRASTPSAPRIMKNENVICVFSNFLQERTNLWRRWRTEYLATLRNRIWKPSLTNFKVNDLVYVHKYKTNEITWPIGIIRRIFPSSDGTVRLANVEINGQIIQYHTKLLSSLECVDEPNNSNVSNIPNSHA